MLVTVLSGLLIVAAPQAGVVNTEKAVSFIGFSEDESAAAWRIMVSVERASGVFDEYTLVRVVDTASNLTLETYRDSDIRRTNNGSRVKVPVEYMSSYYPEWGRAAPRGDWQALAETAKFNAIPVTSRSAVLSVVADPDVSLRAVSRGNAFKIVGRTHEPLGYTLQVVDGRRTLLGRYREEGKEGQTISATVHLMRSKSGNLLAVLNRFDRDESTISYGKIVPVTAEPILVARQVTYTPDFNPNLAIAAHLHAMANLNFW